MKSPAADQLLRSVERRLRRQHIAAAARFATWATTSIALVAVLLHLFVRPMGIGAVALTVSICWAAAMLQALLTPIRTRECAEWADRHLGGSSAYSTYLEFASKDGEARSVPALARLLQWIEQAARSGMELLDSMSQSTGVMKPAAVALVAALLAIALLQIPTHARAPASTPGSAQVPAPAPGMPGAAGEPDAGDEAAAAVAARPRRSGAAGEGHEAGGRTPSAPGARSSIESRKSEGETPGAADAKRAAAGGRDAGDSPDRATDAGLSEAWQGELATALRPLSEPTGASARTDSGLAAEFSTNAAANGDARPAAILTPAPAAAPEARRTVRLGPAEQAYVRAYFAGSGATP